MELESSIETTLNQIQKVMNANSIIGDAIDTGDKVIIPISKTALGFGIGAGEDSGKNIGGTAGGGSVDPVAVIIVSKNVSGPEGVKILPLNGSVPFTDMLADAGQHIMELIGGNAKKSSSNKKKAKEEKENSTVDEIKTKIKPEK